LAKNKSRSFQFPHVFALLFILIIIVSFLVYIIPSGEFDTKTMEDGREVVVEGTYHAVHSNPPNFFDIFNSVHKGMEKGAGIIFFIFIVGGTFGMAEETIPMILIFVPLALRMGFDSIVGTAMVIVGSYAGFTAAFMNPFTVGVAQEIAELPLFSGMTFRLITFSVYVTVTVVYVMLYAKKVRKKPEISLMHELDSTRQNEDFEKSNFVFSGRQSVIILLLGITIIGIAVGVIWYDWYITEIAGLFLLLGVIAGFVGKLKISEIANSFTPGCSDLVVGALVVGFADGMLVILEDSNTIDTVLCFASIVVSQVP